MFSTHHQKKVYFVWSTLFGPFGPDYTVRDSDGVLSQMLLTRVVALRGCPLRWEAQAIAGGRWETKERSGRGLACLHYCAGREGIGLLDGLLFVVLLVAAITGAAAVGCLDVLAKG